jgi:hypothetical protein
MAEDSSPPDVEKADQYRHDDGSVEIVFAVEEGRVLSVREYPSEQRFADAVSDAEYAGTHEEMLQLPPVEAFQDDED